MPQVGRVERPAKQKHRASIATAATGRKPPGLQILPRMDLAILSANSYAPPTFSALAPET
ncbi:MAG: hypothetical protein AB7T37_11045, partial [Dehalococcoidia bacterium]